ncbi:MAG: hypothetical protein JSV50_11090 [Desulfobacteraceae bacterium]|nr:MAG: hypothetical protein JSV50_11090 [Desulfobacteraceae bacterium]
MLITPKENPFIDNLNSYYLDIGKLIEHCQGELGSGAIHFRGPTEEGIVFFDKDEILDGTLQNKDGELGGKTVIKRLIASADNNNFIIDIYGIDPEKIYFWANMRGAKKIYKDLSTEFTDLEGLIKKMISEKLTGYIEVSINEGKEGGLIFFTNGEIIGGSYSWGKGELNGSQESQKLLIEKTKESGGVFHVSRISFTNEEESDTKKVKKETSSNVLPALEDLLVIFERTLKSNNKSTTDFNTLLKKKFVEMVDKYAFLDPFTAEFDYDNQKIRFTGNASDEELVNGVIESVEDLAGELGILPQFVEELAPWSQKHAKEVARFGISY